MFVLGFILAAVAAYAGDIQGGAEIYSKHCSRCHGAERVGLTAPPLFSPFIKTDSDDKLFSTIKKGLPASGMPAFEELPDEDVKALISFMKQPAVVKWTEEDIKKSFVKSEATPKGPLVKDLKNLTVAVDRGGDVSIIENSAVLDSFPFKNIHGGVKFTREGDAFFVPARDGWIGKYDLKSGAFYGKTRACAYLRNISVVRGGDLLLASCYIPQGIVALKASDLSPVKTTPVDGKISAIYEFYSKDSAIFTFRDRPRAGFIDTKTLDVSYRAIDEPMEDFFLEPFERYAVSTSRGGKALGVYDLTDMKKVFEHPTDGMPHLSSASFWFGKGNFYFATAHIGNPSITVWRMYDWKLVKKIDIGGEGYFVRTHPATPYLWIDNGTDDVVLVDKGSLELKTIKPVPGSKAVHTEFSGDGQIAYLSISGKEPRLALYDAATLKPLGDIPAKAPAGKYNFVNKSRYYESYLLGKEVFSERCWGCHHLSQSAFGPSFKWIAGRRSESVIRAHIADPEKTYKTLGYRENAMPKLDLPQEEMDGIIRLFEVIKDGRVD